MIWWITVKINETLSSRCEVCIDSVFIKCSQLNLCTIFIPWNCSNSTELFKYINIIPILGVRVCVAACLQVFCFVLFFFWLIVKIGNMYYIIDLCSSFTASKQKEMKSVHKTNTFWQVLILKLNCMHIYLTFAHVY